MKKLFLILFACFNFLFVYAQTKSCCFSSTETFASFSNDIAFVNKHAEPDPFFYIEQKGEMITFSASDGKDAKAYVIRAKENTNKYLLVFHEWWGLNDYIKQMSDKLFTDIENVNVIAVDLYDGNVTTNRQPVVVAYGSAIALLRETRCPGLQGLRWTRRGS
ncbi:MAG: dienelactone hydrolase family protein [Fimbriimonadaceae bacterium]|nr:dienelactone hydrolase family protein [Chitinophagales bacterium]